MLPSGNKRMRNLYGTICGEYDAYSPQMRRKKDKYGNTTYIRKLGEKA